MSNNEYKGCFSFVKAVGFVENRTTTYIHDLHPRIDFHMTVGKYQTKDGNYVYNEMLVSVRGANKVNAYQDFNVGDKVYIEGVLRMYHNREPFILLKRMTRLDKSDSVLYNDYNA